MNQSIVIYEYRKCLIRVLVALAVAVTSLPAQTPQRIGTPAKLQATATTRAPTHADILRGEYGRYRANNDLLYYHLEVRVDPEKKFLSGKNTIWFKMLKDDTRIQLDLHEALKVDKILFESPKSKVQGPKCEEEECCGEGGAVSFHTFMIYDL